MVIQEENIFLHYPVSQGFSIWVGLTIALVSVLAIKITCINAGYGNTAMVVNEFRG